MKKNYIILTIVVAIISYYFYNGSSNVDSTETQPISIANHVNDKNTDLTANNKKDKPVKLTNHLAKLAILISPITNTEIEENWQNEYGCAINNGCEYFLLDAKSLEDALWMKRKGYLAKSTIDLLDELSIADLVTLANHGNLNAKKLVAIRALKNGNIKQARIYARQASAHENHKGTFGLRLMAQAYLLDKKPILATVELRMASLLGDLGATIEYEQLTMTSARGFIDHVNELAFSFLSAKLQTPLREWKNDPRPIDNGKGGL